MSMGEERIKAELNQLMGEAQRRVDEGTAGPALTEFLKRMPTDAERVYRLIRKSDDFTVN